jgi:rhodanese-related sulfurtransferase
MYLQILVLILNLFPFQVFATTPYTNIDNMELINLQAQGIPVYDIRRAEEWAQTGVVSGSHKLTFVDTTGKLMPDFVEKFTRAVNKNDPVILICRTGHRTDVLSRSLIQDLGYTKVYNVTNGITRWISDGLPVIHN